MAETQKAETPGYSKNGKPSEMTLEVDPADVLAQSMSKAELIKRLERAEKAKAADFRDLSADFWKGEKVNDTIQGVYAGYERGKKYLVHALMKLDGKGKPVAVRINGTAVLTRALKQVEPGTSIRIELTGFDKNDNGDPVHLYSVQELPETF